MKLKYPFDELEFDEAMLAKEGWHAPAIECTTNAFAAHLPGALNQLTPEERYVITRRVMTDTKAPIRTVRRELQCRTKRVDELEKSALEKLAALLAPFV